MTLPRFPLGPIVALCLTVLSVALNAQQAHADAVRARNLLNEAGRVVFLGDSITQAGDFIVDVQCWLFSHGIGNHFMNVGLGSETATDLTPEENAGHVQTYQFARPAVSERLGRVLTVTKPGLLFVCYGMNDAGALPADDSGLKRFTEAITQLRNDALKSGVRKVVVCTPPVHDDKGDASKAFHDANLSRYTSWLLSKRTEGWEIVDFHTPMRKALDDGRATNPAFALAADGTHPGREGHWIMAKQLLQDYFGAETITAASAEDLFPSHGAEIRPLVRELTDLRFNYWMARIGHNRPGVIGGPDQQGSPDLAEFEASQSARLRSIHALWRRAEASSSMNRLVIGTEALFFRRWFAVGV
jgi:lysophospholipase L1-like esterase